MQAPEHYSLYLSRLLASGQLDGATLAEPLTPADYAAFAPWDELDETTLMQKLRQLRQRVMGTLIVRDLSRRAQLAEITRTITEFADFSVNTALSFAYGHYARLYGLPRNAEGDAQHLSVVAMGKMGGYELNVSSDIDLIFVYGENGETDGKRSRSNGEFFIKVGQKLITLLNDRTAEGQVFRVDMRLRPDGDSGALAISEFSLEQYLVQHGREWERYAWIKGRVLTPYPNGIYALVKPFVYRRYLDYNAFEAMRGLHRQIRQEVGRRGLHDNIKLGAGGIREVEFIAQMFQLIRGGRERSLQLRGTQDTLNELARLEILEPPLLAQLLEAYRFLRDTEHRLQYWDDQQTQRLPEGPEQQALLAQSMGFADWPAYRAVLDAHRYVVNQTFNELLAEPDNAPPADALQNVWQTLAHDEGVSGSLNAAAWLSPAMQTRLAATAQGRRYQQLSDSARARFDALMPRVLASVSARPNPEEALARVLDFIDAIAGRSSYLALLHEYPRALGRLIDLMSQSSWVADYLKRHPILLDELLSPEFLQKPAASLPTRQQGWKNELSGSLKRARGDVEAQMDMLRHFQHAQTFRLAAQDLAGLWTIEALSDELSALADTLIACALAEAWLTLKNRPEGEPNFAVIGYGKLGGKELGYASDLDLVYVYRATGDEAALYARLAQRLTQWLSATTAAGALYSIDLRLRPHGESGFAASSFEAYAHYERQEAWTWEHQALTRARWVAGATPLHDAFEALRRDILTRERDVQGLREAIVHMREKMFATHPPEDNDVKYARGGVVDVEFIVQYLILEHSHAYPELALNHGNIALLGMAAERNLIDAQAAQAAAQAYRAYRQVQHNTRLRDAPLVKADAALVRHYEAVRTLWLAVFGEGARFQAA